MELPQLTKAEEKVMRIVWDLDGAFTKDILECFDDPKPSYSTVATMVRLLENKGYVRREAHGQTHKYLPAVPKSAYAEREVGSLVEKYFGGSLQQMVSFFSKRKKMRPDELDGIIRALEALKDPSAKP